ncbi:uncharacterized protein ARMOST_03565 [Armillaria ostoyae]|uniref:Uncharacterized protein n=1 Tax=Armillaria ostoyae TaxID=47428 RepID=A0A284QV01_ARMOS|nr:uncharacterized protein ARMOST_03565 [Armillaria ostoyae]
MSQRQPPFQAGMSDLQQATHSRLLLLRPGMLQGWMGKSLLDAASGPTN